MIPLESPPIQGALFLTQTFSDSEYWRRYKPNGNHYQSLDCATKSRCHAGYDLQGAYHEPLLATNDGEVRWAGFNFGSSFGVQSLLIPTGQTYGLFYAHQAWRTVTNGQKVKAGQKIGVMGTTGGVQQHLHFSATTKVSGGVPCWFNCGAELRELKEGLMPLNDDDKKWIQEAIYRGAREAVRALAVGQNAKDGAFPDDGSWNGILAHNIRVLEGKLP